MARISVPEPSAADEVFNSKARPFRPRRPHRNFICANPRGIRHPHQRDARSLLRLSPPKMPGQRVLAHSAIRRHAPEDRTFLSFRRIEPPFDRLLHPKRAFEAFIRQANIGARRASRAARAVWASGPTAALCPDGARGRIPAPNGSVLALRGLAPSFSRGDRRNHGGANCDGSRPHHKPGDC
jgi:hypothetical protein